MKPSTLLSKKLRSFRTGLTNSTLVLLLPLLTLVSSSCQYSNREPEPLPKRLEYRALSSGGKGQVFAHASSQGCEQGIPHFWLLEFQSAFGAHQLKLDYSNFQAGEETLVIFNQHRFLAQLPIPLTTERIRELCEDLSPNAEPIVVLDPGKNSTFQIILQTIAPNCEVQVRDGSLYCKLPSHDAATSLRKLTAAHQSLVTRWERHPYILARRIALARSLAQAINSADTASEMQRICRIVEHSIAEELPLAMRSSRWYQTACRSQGSGFNEALLVSLYDAISEIEALTDELRTASRLGMLTVRIPRQTSPAQSFWVTLKPVTIDRTGDEQLASPARPPACWHPLYDQNRFEQSIAHELGLLAEPSLGSCNPLARDDLDSFQTVAIQYIKNSIASETEFAISNGRGKVLRLPKGEYYYTIEPHRSPFTEVFYPEESPPDQTTGTLSWQSARPHPIIRNW